MYGPKGDRFPKIAILPTSYIGLLSTVVVMLLWEILGLTLTWVIAFLLRLKLLCEEYI